MWNLCRPAALQQLQRTRTLLLQTPLRSLRATVSAHVAPFSRTFATSSSVAGVEMSRLLESSPSDLEAELGRGKIVEVQQALAKEFATVIKQEDATSEDLLQLFSAAQKTRLPSVMTRAFDELKDKFPESIDFTMYGEIFRILSRQHEGEKMKEIYEFARPRFEPTVPEIVFRYGIVGNIETGNMEDAQRIADDMERNYQLPLTNEIYSYLIGGYAREKNVKTVLDIYEALDPQVGQWHESAVDRVILSLGIIGKPQLAFEFYVNSNMKLNGGTLITLLSVCRHNDCRQQASDILENRKRFNLRLNARAYNAILETLEYLDRRDEIINILNEMNNDGIRFDTRTKAIVARNQDVLEGTFFDRKSNPNSALKSNKEDKKSKTNKKRTAFVATPELRKLLSEKKFTEAAALADQYVRPMTSDDLPEEERESTSIEEGALHTQASVMKEVIQAFMANGETKKVDGLLKGIELSKNKVGYALIDVLTKYANDKKHNKLAYRAAKLMLAQGWQIHRAGDALQVFRDFNDAEGAHALCMQLLDEFTANQRSKSDGDDKSTKKTGNSLSPATVATTFGWTVRILADNNDLPRALALFDKAQESGIRIEPFHYIGILAAMRKHSAHIAKQKGVVVLADNYRTKPFCYMSDDFEAVLDDMEKRGVRMTRGVISNACIALAGGNKRQRLRLLEGYAATRDEEVKFDTPTVVYSVLLQVCGKELGDNEEMKKIYDEGVASLAVQADGTKRIPLDWEVVVISHLSDAGQIDDALERLKAMRAKTGTYSYEAAVKVLRGAIVAKHESAVTAAVELMEQREFKPTLSDTYDLVHLAREAERPYVALDIIGMYERAHGRTTKDAVDHAKSRQSHRDKYAVRKIRAMYRVVLNMCEQNGEWKRALAFSTRVNEILRYETGEDDDDASEDFSSDKQQ